ncbi:MAG: AAA family ATPase [Bryobacterales bacterium]|nr:AAA family ATPase [Bryobacterales bacterium]
MYQRAFIEAVRIEGFRSLADISLTGLGRVAVLIGSNGSGKSNFIRFFEMLSWMIRSRRLSEFVARNGGADDQLYGGSSKTLRIKATVSLRTDAGLNEYHFALSHAHPDRLLFTEEAFRFSRHGYLSEAPWQYLESGNREASIVEAAQSPAALQDVNPQTASVIVSLLRNCSVYQFHDTSDSSNFKTRWDADDSDFLRSHGGNLAAVLYRLERNDLERFERVCSCITRVLPTFDRFSIEESFGRVLLRWKAKGSDKTYGPHLTSDGSLRFLALVTLLNLPPAMLPDVLLLDEPELGLHPAAIALVGGMINSVASERQVIVATQSPLLVNAFNLEEIVVFEHTDDRTECKQLDPAEYRQWLEDGYTSGDLWWKNLLGGYP